MKRSNTFASLAVVLAMASGPASSVARAQQSRSQESPGTTSTSSPEPAAAHRPEVMLSVVPTNPKLLERLQLLLPRGTSVQEAARGFHDQHQFLAAVQLSHNLKIPFRELRAHIVEEGLSVGQAVQIERPDVDVGHELRRARRMVMEGS